MLDAPSRSARAGFGLTLALWALVAAPGARAEVAPFETAARAAMLIDHASGAVLFSKEADVSIPPASMSKLMTAYLVFESLKSGRLNLDDRLRVSEKAWRMGGSKMFVRVNDQIRVEDLLRGVIIQSGNDACIVLAEAIAGSEEAFAARMTAKAEELGMRQSHFMNATGWPHPDHRMSARDLAIIAERILTDFPEYYHLYGEREFTWEGIRQANRNPLLSAPGADGLKTGHTEEAGYGLVGSALREGRRLTLVVSGLDSENQRAQEAERLLNWGFREFETFTVGHPGLKVGEAEVWIGERPSVSLVVENPLTLTAPVGAREQVQAEIVYQGPAPAPIRQGQRLGALRVSAPGIDPIEIPLVAGEDVARGGFAVKLRAGASTAAARALRAAGLAGEEKTQGAAP
ncbi:D-alanyl-D-alanine carboxypeptidase family protein [Neomegalonema sp.]|uniref:D-alanyl-D-alanine carboxypeptidase family protein n=1 Tax=Neomegalonema sp. TaxID=2039713 RepID=UPI002601C1C2|nr:D-alanyl-D-alanine carboxypeptidase family protein [Neomegalonema sp.]MDD2869389.1 D-alanyl-D-alanine carboxypeptidase [Neomegalonema sp.]